MVGALFGSICQIFPVWFQCICCFRLTTVLEIAIQTHYITFQDTHFQPIFKWAYVNAVLWPALISNVVDVSLSAGSLGYWAACNHFKRYCMLPFCVLTNLPYEAMEYAKLMCMYIDVWTDYLLIQNEYIYIYNNICMHAFSTLLRISISEHGYTFMTKMHWFVVWFEMLPLYSYGCP